MQDTPSPRDFVGALAPAVRQAASIARALEGRVANRPKGGESTAVKAALTLADTAAQEALLVPLLEHFPNVRLEAEEDTPSVSRFPQTSDSLVVIDPIDGTLRFYLEGSGPYAIMVGLAHADRYEAGLVALPRERLCFEAVRGAGARVSRDDARSETVPVEPDGDRVLVSHNLPAPALASLRRQGLEPMPASGGAISVAPLLSGVRAGLRLARENPEGVSVRGRIGALIAAEAGAAVAGLRGPFSDSLTEPEPALLVAARETDIERLREALSAI